MEVQPPGGTFEPMALSRAPACSADEHGPLSGSFAVRVPGGRIDERHLAENPVRITRGGRVLWGGRIADVKRIPGDQIDIALEGWQRLLDDDPIDPWYVHQRMSDWEDSRGITTDIRFRPAAEVTASAKGVRLSFPNGSVLGANSFCGVTYDYGEKTRGPKRIRVTGSTTNNSSTYLMWVRGHDTPATLITGTVGTNQRDAFTGLSLNTLGSSFNVSDDFNGGETYRYVTALLFKSTAETAASDYAVDFSQITGYAAASYDGGISGVYYSALRASAIFTDIADQVAGLSSDQSLIEGTSFDISELGPQGYKTPREFLAAANAYHDYIWGVDAERRLYFTPRPTTSALRAAPRLRLEGGSLSSTARNFNRVLVQGTDTSGQPITVERTSTNGLLDRQGVTRAKVLGVSAVIPQATAETIGDAWLAERGRTPAKGSITVGRRGEVTDAQGQPLDPEDLLAMPGQRIRLDGEIDPDTGELGRSGIVRSVSYVNGAAQLSIDDETNNLQIVLNRYAANLAGGG